MLTAPEANTDPSTPQTQLHMVASRSPESTAASSSQRSDGEATAVTASRQASVEAADSGSSDVPEADSASSRDRSS